MIFRRSRFQALTCSAVFLLCELICRPWAEIGIADDWSYIQIAQTLARTGHITYNAWVTPIIGWQLYIAAFLYRLFGFSFTAPRISTLVIGTLLTFLMQRTLVRLGISSFNAAVGTLILVLSPLFMMLSVTFMTDIPGLFALILCFYACIRTLQATSDRNSLLWILFAVAGNCICGSSRQIAWLGVLVVVPCTLWLLRSRRFVLLRGVSALALGYLFVFFTLHWFTHSPYTQPERFTLPPLNFANLAVVIGQYDRAALTLTLLLLPVLILFLAEVRRWSGRSFTFAAGVIAAIGLLFFSIRHAANPKDLLSPFVGDWVGIHGNYNGLFLNGQQPPILIGHYLHLLLGLLACASLLCTLVTLLSRREELPSLPAEPLTRNQLFWLFGPFSFVYTLLLLNRAEQILFDRYLLAPGFVFIFVTLRFYQRHVRQVLPPVSIAMLCLLAGWGIVCTHNLFALDRARVTLGKEILDAGVPPNSIDFGWDQNGWVALQQEPAINGDRVTNPPNRHLNIVDPHLPVCYGQSVFFGLYPHLAPQYGVAFDPNACAGLAPFAPVSYTSWPDLQRVTLYVVHYPPPWRPESDYAVPAIKP